MSLLPFKNVFDRYGSDWQIFDPFRDEFFSGMRSVGDLTKPFSPLLTADLIETPAEYQVFADLPGVEPSDLDISIDDCCLVMKAERKHTYDTRTGKVHSLERTYGTVQRRIQLPKNCDCEHVQTLFKNGVLTVTFPKRMVPPASKKLTINMA